MDRSKGGIARHGEGDSIYRTKFISLTFYADNRVRLYSDGLIECGDYSKAEVNTLLVKISEQGWSLVGTSDRTPSAGALCGMDLYFRTEVD